MALRIKHQGEVFMVEGNLNPNTLNQFKNHLEFLMLNCEALTLNIDGLNTIDKSGIQVLKELYIASLVCHKQFVIVGKRGNKIYSGFQSNNAA